MFNYHCHRTYTNSIIIDSVASTDDYISRTVELGQQFLSSCDHGAAISWPNVYDLAEKNNLRFRYVAEPYFVLDRKEKDRTNCHIIVAAKTIKGIGDLNFAISEANISGYYYVPRLDLELLLSLDPKDVFITSACLGFWKYGHQKSEEIVVQLKNHFGKSFMLEVQPHHTPRQKELNELILKLYRKHNIPLIAGMDSHYINQLDAILRDELLKSKGLSYPDEDGWFMDFPSEQVFFSRFKKQGVLSPAQITEAINNTLVFADFEDIKIDKSRKIPTIYPELSMPERNEKYRQLIREKWNQYSGGMPEEEKKKYYDKETGIPFEVETVTQTNSSDYFLFNHELIKRSVEKGGILSNTGRGSNPSFFTNMLLDFTSIDRFKAPVELFPARFASVDRLKQKLPDIDFNIANREVFEETQKELLGEWGALPMVAFGTLQRASAFRMYCRINNVPQEIVNAVSESLKKFEMDKQYAEESVKDEMDVFDYIPEKYHEYVRKSEMYLGVIDSWSQHPCAYLLFNGDIRREIGVVRINSKNGPVLTAMITGEQAEAWGYLKNDLLIVTVTLINYLAYQRIMGRIPDVEELTALTNNDRATWDIYAKGLTLGLNQVEQYNTTQRVMTYKPRNTTELSAFVAAIRPGFKSNLDTFLNRRKFEYGIKALDTIVQTREMKSSFLIYQEQIMKVLAFAGFDQAETYTALTAISKKKQDKILLLKPKFFAGFSERIKNEDSSLSQKEIKAMVEDVWQILLDNSSYSFNSSHALCVALDSLYGAYAKAHYPLEYYATLLEVYSAKDAKDKERLGRIKSEMRKGFGIVLTPARFGQDNRSFYMDKENNSITDSLVSVKSMSQDTADFLYSIKDQQFDSFTDMLVCLTENSINATKITILIKMGYFEKFGKENKLLGLYSVFRSGKIKYAKTLVPASKQKRIEALKQLETELPDEAMSVEDKMRFEVEAYGSPVSVFKSEKKKFTVIDVDTKFSPKVDLYSVSSGATGRMKVKKEYFNNNPLSPGDTIILHHWSRKPAYTFVNKKSVKLKDKYDDWAVDYEIL